MGLRSPFGYIGYEVTFGNLLVKLLDELCSHCHTNDDYHKGCRQCPAGNLIYEIKEYLEDYDESDKRFELYASDEWAERAKRKPSEEERRKELSMADDYRPECNVLRLIKPVLKRIKPKPCYYVRSRGGFKRPKPLEDFATLIEDYSDKRKARLNKWGLGSVT